MYLPYTGIGSRETPDRILRQMTKIAKELNHHGFTLRSGGADGADTAFERGSSNKEIFLPWKNFNGNKSQFQVVSMGAMEIASKHHPVWDRLSGAAKKLMARNVYQVLGFDLTSPSRFVICYTKDGCEHDSQRTRDTGGTGMAISIASLRGIKVYNLANYQSLFTYDDILDEVLGEV